MPWIARGDSSSKARVLGTCRPSAVVRVNVLTVAVVLKSVYDPHGRVAGHVPVTVPKQVWTYNFGSSRLMYILTFLEGALVKIETGGYGH